MYNEGNAARLVEKTALNTIQVELQEGYSLSPVEAQELAQRVQEFPSQWEAFSCGSFVRAMAVALAALENGNTHGES